MELSFSRKKISMEKELSPLDKFVFRFCRILDKLKIRYVIVSGYVAIAFGRSRNTEDIDILIEKMGFEKFAKLWNALLKKYDCINVSDPKSAYFEYLTNKTAIRFAEKGAFIPNFEFKFVKNEKDAYSLDNSTELQINKKSIRISPLEMQIAYKLRLGSVKDIEDARFLFRLFDRRIDKKELKKWLQEFNVPAELAKKLGA